MSFIDIGNNIQMEYKTKVEDAVNNFYIPCLKEAVRYDRAVGFFSTSILLYITNGLASLAANNGKMRFIISPKLSKEDYKAIQDGYDAKKLMEEKVVSNFDEIIEYDQKKDRFGLLSYMISTGLLEIKLALLEEQSDKEMYHEKYGIMYDSDGNIIAFSGSANETFNGWFDNYEGIDVYCSWKGEENRCLLKSMSFNHMWDGNAKGLIILPFPKVIEEKLIKYVPSNLDDVLQVDKKFVEKYKEQKNIIQVKTPTLNLIKSKGEDLFEYQYDAIAKWNEYNFKGIFDMATGTGKTYTACGAICSLFEKKKRLFVIICVPYIHLADQWADEVKEFNIDPIVCYGGSKYDKILYRYVNKFKQKRTDFVCVIIVNKTFSSSENQKLLTSNLKNTLLIVDEAHNFGSKKLSELLKVDYEYRLALSATLDRYGDEKGTQILYDFFGKKCIEYKLDRAIIEKKLTSYKYFPVIVSLTTEELEEYNKLSVQISKLSGFMDMDEPKFKSLLIKRARIIAGAKNKLDALYNILKCYINEHNMLIYCGTAKYTDDDFEDLNVETSQIKLVVKHLNDMGIMAHEFTANENQSERRNIINSFKSENGLQALVAIKCLDEGVNIPAIKTAFILASSMNPKEYIQRRGRVLRNYPGKTEAIIYDFITIPRSLDNPGFPDIEFEKYERNMINRELIRVTDFVSLAKNGFDCNTIIDKIKDAFNMHIIKEDIEEW